MITCQASYHFFGAVCSVAEFRFEVGSFGIVLETFAEEILGLAVDVRSATKAGDHLFGSIVVAGLAFDGAFEAFVVEEVGVVGAETDKTVLVNGDIFLDESVGADTLGVDQCSEGMCRAGEAP